ncbi:putative E3 ubiquitin-protein ligase RING1a [Bienertia sinuspersici]
MQHRNPRIIRKTRTVMECLHRFCRECIDKSMRMGCEPFCLNLINRNNECPACRTHCASRRSLRDDPNWDTLISSIYPDIDLYEEEELAFQEDEKARNHQIQSAIAQTVQRQTEALSRKRRRSQGNYRRKRNYRSEDDDDANGHDGEKDSSSADERCTEPKPKRPKRWRGQLSPAAVSGEGAGNENDQEVHREVVVPPVAFAGTSEMLVWGKGGIRSNTRYGSGSGVTASIPVAALQGWLNIFEIRTKMMMSYIVYLKVTERLDIQVVLVSLDEQKEPLLQHPYLCGKPALSVGQLCQASPQSLSSLSTMEVETPGYTAFDACKDELQVLDAKETLAGLKAASNFAQGHLMLAYRQKIM